MNILLIRHGKCLKAGINPHLTACGKTQAKKLAALLKQIPINKAYVSDQTRAVETFEAYKKLNPKIKFVKTGKLKEIYRVVVGGPKREGTPPSRKIKDKKRMESFWKGLLKSKDENIAVFAHGNVIRYLLSKAKGIDPKKSWKNMTIDCCSISLIQINKKILAIIKSDKGKYLLLKTNPAWLKVDAWYVVTGSLERGETYEDGVKREVAEEIGLEILKIIPTEYACDYAWPEGSNKMHHEKAFIVIVKDANPVLSGEHTAFEWLSKDKFIKKIAWWGNKDKKDLKKLLNEY